MKWIAVCDTVVDVERYRLFMLEGCSVTGLNEYENGETRITEEIAGFSTEEQAEAAFEEFKKALVGLKTG